jgi:hypothetical protein
MNERHLKRLMAEYVRYYHEDRTHLGLRKDTPAGRLSANHPAIGSSIRSLPRLGGHIRLAGCPKEPFRKCDIRALHHSTFLSRDDFDELQ